MSQLNQQFTAWFENRVSRRSILRGSLLGGAGLAMAALVGCDDDDDDDDDGSTPTATAAGTDTATPTGTATTPTATATATATAGNGGAASAIKGDRGVAPGHTDGDYAQAAIDDGAPYPYNYPEPSTTPKKGGIFRNSVAWDVGTWDPNASAGFPAMNMATIVGDRLVGVATGPEMSKYRIDLQPELAQSWETDSAGLTYTFTLQEGVRFHDVPPVNGRELVANDVVLAFERARTGVQQGFFGTVDTIQAPDDRTVVIKLNQPDADFLSSMSNRGLPIYAPEPFDEGISDQTAIGTGPGILGEVRQGSSMMVDSNPDYWQGAPLLDGMEYVVILDPNTQVAEFRVGNVERGSNISSTPQAVDLIYETNPDALITCDPYLAGVQAYALNSANPKFADPRVRQGLMLSGNQERALEIAYQGIGKTLPAFGWTFVFDQEPTGDELGPWFHRDLDEASKLLSAAGASALEFDLTWSAAIHGLGGEQVNTIMAEGWQEVGVTMRPQNVDPPAFSGQFFGRSFEEAVSGFSTTTPNANGYFYDNMHSQSPKAYFAINDSQIDEWAEQQRSEVDPDARREILRQIWDRTLDQAYRIDLPLFFIYNILAPSVRHYRFNGPYIGVAAFFDMGLGFHKAWLDK